MKQHNQKIFNTTFSRYVASEIIGEGGAGRVYKVADEAGQSYAIKSLDPTKTSGEKQKRFKNELFFQQKNQHRNIVTVIDYGYISSGQVKTPFYVMPLYNGSLRTLMSLGIAHDRVLYYFGMLLDGVEAAHFQKVIHRDLKPENFLYAQNDDKLLLADFGTALFQQEDLFTSVETKPGTRLANFQYAAPEQRSRTMSVDHRADIYALGLMLNEMFTREVPQGTGYRLISSVNSQFSYLDDLVSLMIRQSPEERPATIDIVKQQLIGRKNEFITRQQLSKLKQTVIPVSDIDDPLIIDPIHLISFDWEKGQLTLVFNQPINQTWLWAFQNMGSHTSVYGKGPERFNFTADKAWINADEKDVQPIINYFKSWLPEVNRLYEQRTRQNKEEAERKQRQQLEKEIEALEQRKRVLNNVKI